eukprot:8541831-Karenia_brevis.AAC.1
MADTGASIVTGGLSPFVDDRIPVQSGPQVFPDGRSNADLPLVGDYIVQVVGVDSVEEFDAMTKRGGFSPHLHRIPWWGNFWEGPPPSKKSKNRQQPF